MITRFLFLFLLLMGTAMLQAQDFGAFPPSTRWKQINTDTVRVLFEAKAEAQARRIADLVHAMAADTTNDLGKKVRKVNVLLHGNTTLANGFVTLAPFRSEFYLIPGSNIFEFGNLPWNEQLAIHEYRHVHQYNNFRKGVSKLFYYLLGEEGQAVANGLVIPNWFWEGDAVHAETALTPGGRGRMPYFFNAYNSLWQAGREYRRAKLLNGSYRDFVPSHYHFGYFVTNYGYLRYGSDFWKRVTSDAAAWKNFPTPFPQAVKKWSKRPPRKLQKEALTFYKEQMKEEREPLPKAKAVTHYYFPQYAGKDSLVYLKSGYRDIPSFYLRDSSGERKIRQQHISSEEWFSFRNGRIAYTAFAVRPRWALTSYSDIILLDIGTGEEKRLTEKGRYYSPDFAPSGTRLVAAHYNDSLQMELHLISTETGRVEGKIKAPAGALFVHPRFLDEEHLVLALRTPDSRMVLQQLHLPSGKTTDLLPAGYNTIGFPVVQGDTVFFTGSFAGNDDLYALRLKDRALYQLTKGNTGHYFPALRGDSIAWSHFTANGFGLQTALLSGLLWSRVSGIAAGEEVSPYPVALTGKNILQTGARAYPVKPYSKTAGIFNYHSWRPDYTDPEFTFSLYGDNVLSTFSNSLFYRYNRVERSHGGGAELTYGGWFPQLTAAFEYTKDRHIPLRNRTYLLDQAEWRIGYSVPLNLTWGKTLKYLRFGTDYAYTRRIPKGDLKPLLPDRTSDYLSHTVQWQHQRPRPVQHIYPHGGYNFFANLRDRTDRQGYQLYGQSQVFLPGGGNKSLVLSGAFQQRNSDNILFTNRFASSRGYGEADSSRMWRASVNYHLPLAYPDLGIAGVVYLLRVRTNLYYDHAMLYTPSAGIGRRQRSAGTELLLDTKWCSQVPITLGVRYSYLVDPARGGKRSVWEFVIPLDIIPD